MSYGHGPSMVEVNAFRQGDYVCHWKTDAKGVIQRRLGLDTYRVKYWKDTMPFRTERRKDLIRL